MSRCATLVVLGLAVLTVSCQSKVDPPLPSPQAKAKALAARDALFEKLSGRLMAAMGEGGPASAIEVCSKVAPELAVTVGEQQGVRIGRTSFELRNPANVPPEWAEPLIQERVASNTFLSLPDGATGALLPIRLKAQCLLCHGAPDAIPEEVRAKLSELYPEDEATGFEEGDLRGWFWVVVPATGAEGGT